MSYEANFDTDGGFMVAGGQTITFWIAWYQPANESNYQDFQFAVQQPFTGYTRGISQITE
jgi:hypothetical protein